MGEPNCDTCNGACCRHVVSPPFYGAGDPTWERLQTERPDLVAEMFADLQRRKDAGLATMDYEAPCHWLDRDSGKCRHYDLRPEICRDYDVGDEPCIKARKLYQIGT
jgi:Fe-S-cluster containining protein